MLARKRLKSFKQGFNGMWTEKFHMYKFRKGRGTRDQTANIGWIIKKAKEFQENIYIDYTKALDCVDQNKLWKIFKKRWEYQTTLPVSWKTCMWVKKQQLELDMEQWTGSKLGKEYDKAVYCHLT